MVRAKLILPVLLTMCLLLGMAGRSFAEIDTNLTIVGDDAVKGKPAVIFLSEAQSGKVIIARGDVKNSKAYYSSKLWNELIASFAALSEHAANLSKSSDLLSAFSEKDDQFFASLEARVGEKKIGRYRETFGTADQSQISALTALRLIQFFASNGKVFEYDPLTLKVKKERGFQTAPENIDTLRSILAENAQAKGLEQIGSIDPAVSALGGRNWVAGYAPADKPEIAFFVGYENATSSLQAVETAKKMVQAYFGRKTVNTKIVRVGLYSRLGISSLLFSGPQTYRIFNTQSQVMYSYASPEGWWEIRSAHGKVELKTATKTILARSLTFLPSGNSKTPGIFMLKSKRLPLAVYRGELEIASQGGELRIVNALPIDDYIKALLPAEMSPGFPKEALKAQAVAARTYAFQHLGKHAKQGFDYCDTTHCQAFLGVQKEDSRSNQAVDETAGLVLTYHGSPINAIYQSTCGGKSASNEVIFGGKSIPYLSSVDDQNYCEESPFFKQWEFKVKKEKLLLALQKDDRTNPGSELKEISVEKTDITGHPWKIKIKGQQEKTITGYEFWLIVGRTIGYHEFKSTWFSIRKSGDDFVVSGRGNGHGIGLCQWGASGMAKRRFNYKEILEHYYPGTTLQNIGALLNR